uniref:Chlorophyllase n=1 Tax=Quercus lobata TaxID=97700 RepID=A0A7N2R5Y9_QUELO
MSSATTATAANTADAATSTQTNVFAIGRYKTVLQTVETRSCTTKSTVAVPPPKPLLIARPSEAGEYPILVLLHGYLLYNSFYSQLIQHIASHGFIVIAPQANTGEYTETPALTPEPLGPIFHIQMSIYHMIHPCFLYILAGPDTADEIKSTAAITNWLSEGLHYLLPPHVQPNINKLGLAGHSRGGKVAFALALDKEATSLKFSALIGIDPVDGMDKGKQTPPPVLTYVPHSFDLDMAVMVIGTGLGEVKKNPLFPPCAPKGVNHEDFFNECQEPACHFVAKDYGHLDLLDDDTEGLRGKTTYCLCKNGKSREPMRRFVGGIVVAFMNAYLLGDNKDLLAIKDGQKTVPVELKPIVCIG